jgi:uncharacterized protein (TIGR03083 family)
VSEEMEAAMDALAAEVVELCRLLDALPDAEWGRPTRLPDWDVTTLVAHLARGMGRIAEYGATPVNQPPERDRVSYWQYDPVALAPGVSARAREAARDATPDSLRAALREAVDGGRATVARLAPDTVLPSVMGPIAAAEFLPTRLLEACVHGLDLRHALGAPSTPTPGVLASTVATLTALLGAARPPDLQDDVAFVEAGTGRRPFADPRFPLLG